MAANDKSDWQIIKVNKKQQQPNVDIAVHVQLLGKLDFQGISLSTFAIKFRCTFVLVQCGDNFTLW